MSLSANTWIEDYFAVLVRGAAAAGSCCSSFLLGKPSPPREESAAAVSASGACSRLSCAQQLRLMLPICAAWRLGKLSAILPFPSPLLLSADAL